MKPCVVDASVVAAAFFQEDHAAAARAILVAGGELHAPDFLLTEVANVIWKRHGRREIDEAEARQLLADCLRLPLKISPSSGLVEPALELAMRTKRTVYDCLYLALAVKTKAVLVSTDKRFVNALAGGPFEKHIAWLGSLPER
ncbi:MAG: type II toxin-antitoxin system VapC family toxin, partial [Planctomycetota bacterium]|nr:type II toxin-antitoxin system VapC family toxin [Planctomycetota bacterium]